MKKIILLLTILSFYPATNIFAQSEAIFRSVVFPGWGQFYNNQPNKGLILIAGEILTLSGYYYFNNQADNKYNDYLVCTDPVKTASLFDEVEQYKNSKHLALYAVGGLWLLNVLDAWIFYDESKHSDFSQNELDILFEPTQVSICFKLDLNIIGGVK